MLLKRALVIVLLAGAAFAQTEKSKKNYDKAMVALDRHNPVAAEKALKEAVEDSPNWALAYLELGHVYALFPKNAQAIESLEKARELDGKDHQLKMADRRDLYTRLGILYGTRKEYGKSIAVLQEGIQNDPDYGGYEYNLACAYSEAGDLDKAISHLKRAWELRGSFQFPDVNKDSSFKRWRNDPRFQEVARNLVI
ncbi:TPR repeat protein [Candidatus Koribacter versatilis Ellin345]|uniref:TPR repeat protein n=1 Tax=Koribacter versatilis (strain Ellin345) TaxID=204669 RepID=Q1II11_KORVE|nr:tetratricopeptide repeat protein [Candidatus Koribacter versatilis]ABF43489.1 TPR repeat protein [Candidatus Koribacter versatilis Ellin345]